MDASTTPTTSELAAQTLEEMMAATASPQHQQPLPLPPLEELTRTLMEATTLPEQQLLLSQPPSLEELTRRSTRTMIFPQLLGYIAHAPPSPHTREVFVFVNSRNWQLTLIETGQANMEELLREKLGHLPASKESIDSMPVMKVTETGTECSICLADFEIGGDAKEMPCKHRYHVPCIDKWLEIRGSCPTCRFTMPFELKYPEDMEGGNDGHRDGDRLEAEEGEEEGAPAFVFHVYFVGRRFRRRVRYAETVVAGPEYSRVGENDMEIEIPPTLEEIETHEIENRTYPLAYPA